MANLTQFDARPDISAMFTDAHPDIAGLFVEGKLEQIQLAGHGEHTAWEPVHLTRGLYIHWAI